MKLWHLGNTTVRSPFRLRDGLIALASSPLQGNIRGAENEKRFIRLLDERDVISLKGDVTYSVGRKWRSALEKLGFIYPKVDKAIQEKLGKLDTITPNGWRLVQSEAVPAMQECFLRSLVTFSISIEDEDGNSGRAFFPLQHTLSILLVLEKVTGVSRLSFLEMALIVQATDRSQSVESIVERILDFRKERLAAASKRKFDQAEKEKVALKLKYKESTFNDYADTNFRYLKATGLVLSKGRGISISPDKRILVEKLVLNIPSFKDELDALRILTDGASLPTDDQEIGLEVLQDLMRQIEEKGSVFNVGDVDLSIPANVEITRHRAEDYLFKLNEEDFAKRQQAEWQEIVGYMDLLISRHKSLVLPDKTEISIPHNEAAAYFEWVLWRAFLAINSLVNAPYSSRRFKIDQDFLPVGCAPGGGPDLIFEFDDFVVVGEVTLTDNSRQEAAEGEPVRRHVADLVEKYPGKAVYGLFLANGIDSNTAETFRIGVWYNKVDEKMTLNIIPLALRQFRELFATLFKNKKAEPLIIRQILDSCIEHRPNQEAPVWKLKIDQVISERIHTIEKAIKG